jgi:hypothetical protein
LGKEALASSRSIPKAVDALSPSAPRTGLRGEKHNSAVGKDMSQHVRVSAFPPVLTVHSLAFISKNGKLVLLL